jgi:hypothetical protein
MAVVETRLAAISLGGRPVHDMFLNGTQARKVKGQWIKIRALSIVS